MRCENFRTGEASSYIVNVCDLARASVSRTIDTMTNHVPGWHHQIIQEPHAQELARGLGKALEDAYTRAGDGSEAPSHTEEQAAQ